MQILLFIGIAIIFRAIFDILISQTGGKIDETMSSTLASIAAAITTLGLIFYQKIKGHIIIPTTPAGTLLSIGAGIAVGIFTYFLIESYEIGGLDYTTPLVYGGTIAIASLAGVFLFREQVTTLEVTGIVVILCGMALVIYSKMQGA